MHLYAIDKHSVRIQTLELLLVSYDPVVNLSMYVSADPSNTFPSEGRAAQSQKAECGEGDRYQRCLVLLQSAEMNVVNQPVRGTVRIHSPLIHCYFWQKQ